MTPQDRFIVIAEIPAARVAELRAFLATMNLPGRPGAADPANAIVPFGRYDTIHFARLMVLEDRTLADRAPYPQLPRSEPIWLCLMADCDGDAGALLRRIARECPRLADVFAFARDFDAGVDLGQWLEAHRVRASASYVNWLGRTVVQAREEAALRALLREALPQVAAREPQPMRAALRDAVSAKVRLTPIPPTPPEWRRRNRVHFWTPIVIAVVFLAFFPLAVPLVVLAPVATAIILRRRELTDPIVEQPYDAEWVTRLRLQEDHDVTNQYTAMGSIKPGAFRIGLELVILYALDWFARHVFTRGGLARIGTIHFAHWVLIDGKRRAFFCSNYDGFHEAYMDDFINKAGFGLNLSFSSAIGYPQTDWLIRKGAWREMDFKRFQRRHQIPTDVWYKACPGLTARDLARNARIRNGFEKPVMSDDEIRRWLAEI